MCITDTNRVALFNVKLNTLQLIVRLKHSIEFIKYLNINNCDTIVWRETILDNNRLQVYILHIKSYSLLYKKCSTYGHLDIKSFDQYFYRFGKVP